MLVNILEFGSVKIIVIWHRDSSEKLYSPKSGIIWYLPITAGNTAIQGRSTHCVRKKV